MNKFVAILVATVLGFSIADVSVPQEDVDYIIGPIDIIDSLDMDEEQEGPYVYIEFANPDEPLYIGREVTLRCVMVGIDPDECEIEWQYCTDLEAEDYQEIDCHDVEYTFVATYDNVGYYYRVIVRHHALPGRRQFSRQ